MPLQRLRRALEPLIRRVLHFYWRFSRAATLGARAMVIDGSGRIFLVKHSYVAGWHLPGGGVETGETFLDGAGARTGRGGQYRDDRAAACCTAYSSTSGRRGATTWRSTSCATSARTARRVPNHEIVAHGFFAPDALPEGTTPRHPRPHRRGVRRRGGERGVVSGV